MAGDDSGANVSSRSFGSRRGHGLAQGDTTTPCLSVEQHLAFLGGSSRERRDAETIHRHLDECSACRITMAEAVRGLTEPALAGNRPLFRMLTGGERVADRYQIQRFVARGGMGEVYEALDTVLGERVALKTLAITTADQPEAAEALLREVRIARKVVHPNVCRILEFGIHGQEGVPAGRIPFLTMDFLEGETLKERIRRTGRLSPLETKRVTRALAAGLAAVHAAGIVHRDFKSENVFLVRAPDGTERPVVMDFGLARAFGGSSAASSGARHLVGTASHIAPEQLTGQAVTAAADMFALGIVIFEMLTGRLPFSGDSFAALAFSRLQQRAPLPSSVASGIDRRLDEVVARCLERDPQKRFQRMTDLVGLLGGDATFKEAARPRRVRRAMWVASAAALAALATAAAVQGISRWRTGGAGPARVPVVSPRPIADGTPPTEPARADRDTNVVASPQPPTSLSEAPVPSLRMPPGSDGRIDLRKARTGGNTRPRAMPSTVAPASPPAAEAATSLEENALTLPPPRPRHPDDLGNPF